MSLPLYKICTYCYEKLCAVVYDKQDVKPKLVLSKSVEVTVDDTHTHHHCSNYVSFTIRFLAPLLQLREKGQRSRGCSLRPQPPVTRVIRNE